MYISSFTQFIVIMYRAYYIFINLLYSTCISNFFIGPLSVLNFNGYQVEPGAIINTFVSSFDDSSNTSGSGSGGPEVNFKELNLMCNALSSDDNVRWMVISFSNNNSFAVNITTVNSSLSHITVRISEGEVTIACISEQYQESINITITTGKWPLGD